LALALALVGALLVRADGDPSLLVHAGPPWTTAGGSRGSLTVQPAAEAFDGQFFYRLGVAPWSTAETEAGVTFDLPSLRNARWGYGWLSWAASGGDPDLVPWSLIGVNVVAMAAIGGIGGGLARRAGRHAGWGLAFALWPGFAYSLSLDTSELVASAFVLAGLLVLGQRRWMGAGLCFTAAVLTRDTTAVVAFGVLAAGVADVWATRRSTAEPEPATGDGRALVAVGAAPLAAFVGWQLLQRARFGSLPLTSSGDNNLSAPLAGLVDQLRTLVVPDGSDEVFRLVSMIALALLLGATAWTAWRVKPRRLDPELAAWLAAVGVVVLLNSYLWSGATAFMRATTEAGLLSILLMVRWARPLLLRATVAGVAALWLLTAGAQLAKLG